MVPKFPHSRWVVPDLFSMEHCLDKEALVCFTNPYFVLTLDLSFQARWYFSSFLNECLVQHIVDTDWREVYYTIRDQFTCSNTHVLLMQSIIYLILPLKKTKGSNLYVTAQHRDFCKTCLWNKKPVWEQNIIHNIQILPKGTIKLMESAEIKSIMGEIVADPHIKRQQRKVRKGG